MFRPVALHELKTPGTVILLLLLLLHGLFNIICINYYKLQEEQSGFSPEHSSTDNVFILRHHLHNTFKYRVFAPMGRFQLELIYLYFPPSFHLAVVVSVL